MNDGRLWELWYTAAPQPERVAQYIADAPADKTAGHMLSWAVRELSSGDIIGRTPYHDIRHAGTGRSGTA